MVKHNSKSQQRQQFRNGGSSSQQILTMGAPASSHGPWPSYQGVHDLAFFSFVPSIGSLAHSAVRHFACLPACLPGWKRSLSLFATGLLLSALLRAVAAEAGSCYSFALLFLLRLSPSQS
jgi:hypothetical protein